MAMTDARVKIFGPDQEISSRFSVLLKQRRERGFPTWLIDSPLDELSYNVFLTPGVVVRCYSDAPPRVALQSEVARFRQNTLLVNRNEPQPNFLVLICAVESVQGIAESLTKIEPTFKVTGECDKDSYLRNDLAVTVGISFGAIRVFTSSALESAVKHVLQLMQGLHSTNSLGPLKPSSSSGKADVFPPPPIHALIEESTRLWVSRMCEEQLQTEFITHTFARMKTITPAAIRKRHAIILQRCLGLVATAHPSADTSNLENRFEAALQSLLDTQSKSSRPVMGAPPPISERESLIQRYVSPRYRFWFTPTGLSIFAVFTFLLLSTIPRLFS